MDDSINDNIDATGEYIVFDKPIDFTNPPTQFYFDGMPPLPYYHHDRSYESNKISALELKIYHLERKLELLIINNNLK